MEFRNQQAAGCSYAEVNGCAEWGREGGGTCEIGRAPSGLGGMKTSRDGGQVLHWVTRPGQSHTAARCWSARPSAVAGDTGECQDWLEEQTVPTVQYPLCTTCILREEIDITCLPLL